MDIRHYMSDNDDNNNNNNKPKIVGKTIRLAGDVEACGHCKEGDEFFRTNADKTGTNYQYYHIESDKGKEIADNLDADEGPEGSLPIPAIEYCKTIQDGEGGEKEEKCDYIEGFHKSDWDQNLNYKRPNDVDEEIDELFGDDE